MSLIQDKPATRVRLPAASSTAPSRPAVLRAVREFAVLFMAYKLGRVAASGHVSEAVANADDVWRFERLLHLPSQYAAMPSLHFGWAVAVAIAFITATRSRWRWLWLAHPVVTLLVIVVTANHYWLDAFVAGALLAVVVSVQAGWRPFGFQRPFGLQAPSPAIPKPRVGHIRAPGVLDHRQLPGTDSAGG